MNISITENGQEYIKRALNERLQTLLFNKEETSKELKEIEHEIEALNNVLSEIGEIVKPVIKQHNDLNGYPLTASWSKKAAYVISTEQKPLTTREVADIIKLNYQRDMDRKAIVPKVSVALTTTKIFKKHIRKSGETEFSLS